MANLLEALQQPQQMQDTTSQLSTLLRAKSGKAVGGPSLATSTQQEQAALAQTAQAMQPVQQAAVTQQAAQQQQATETAQRAQQQQAQISQSRQANKMQAQLKTDQLLQELEQGKGKIDTARYQANLEQIGQTLRLNSKQYVDNLQREAARARLDNQMQFNEQLKKSILQDNAMLLEKQLGNKSIYAANDREFDIAMSQMGYDTAMSMVRNEIKADKERAAATGIGGLITSGIGVYGKYADKPVDTSGQGSEKPPEARYGESFEDYWTRTEGGTVDNQPPPAEESFSSYWARTKR